MPLFSLLLVPLAMPFAPGECEPLLDRLRAATDAAAEMRIVEEREAYPGLQLAAYAKGSHETVPMRPFDAEEIDRYDITVACPDGPAHAWQPKAARSLAHLMRE